MQRLTRTATALAAALAFGLTVPAAGLAADCEGQNDSPDTMALSDARETTLCLLNEERTSRGLTALREHPELRSTAQTYARLMVSERFFDHVSPGGSTMLDRIKRGDYLRSGRSWIVGENLAWGSGGAQTPAKIVRAWMKSPGHRKNILNGRFRDIGIGITEGAPVRGVTAANGAATYVNNFGARG